MGKLIVATSSEQRVSLKTIQAKAAKNGVTDLLWLEEDDVKKKEPNLRATAALLSPSTGIIDTHALMLALLGEAEENGAMLALNSPVLSAQISNDGICLDVGGEAPMSITAEIVVNAAGLKAIALARQIEGFNKSNIPNDYFCKGNYFSLSRKAPFSHLILSRAGKSRLRGTFNIGYGRTSPFWS